MRKKRDVEGKKKHYCRECRHAVPVERFHTLSISGEPTLAKCKYSPNRCRLLNEEACTTYFKDAQGVEMKSGG